MYKNFLFIVIYLLFILIIFTKNLFAENNFLDINYSSKNINNIKKIWTNNSGIFKDTQSKPVIYDDKIIFLDGFKNLRVVSITSGKDLCVNKGQKDKKPMRGIGLYKKNPNEIYAVFVRNSNLIQVNIINCKEKISEKKLFLKSVVAPVLIDDNTAFILRNGKPPIAYNLDTSEILWEAKVKKEIKLKLINENSNLVLKWNVWGGGVIDKKYNQLIFSTSNPKPGYISDKRLGKNLFHNSIVSVDLNTGLYKWHFQEIEHDLLNLDLASPPILLSYKNKDLKDNDYVAQATKTGQLLLVERYTGKPSEPIIKKKFFPHRDNLKITTIRKYFPDWLTYSKSNFLENDINTLSVKYKNQANKIIKKSIINEYQGLERGKDYIHYGMHGGTEWPFIAATSKGIVVVPSNNIAWVSRLNDSYYEQYLNLIYEIFNFKFHNFLHYLKRIKRIAHKILDYDENDIQQYKKFENNDGIPLNAPPWGSLTAIDVKNKKKLWSVPHGSYPLLNDEFINTGAEIFGSPVIAGNVIFISGTIDKKIIAYDLYSGQKIWSDELPFVSYGNLLLASYNGRDYLIVSSTGGSKMPRANKGDAIVAYRLN
jgi:outer membrane protein assembly factor BamB